METQPSQSTIGRQGRFIQQHTAFSHALLQAGPLFLETQDFYRDLLFLVQTIPSIFLFTDDRRNAWSHGQAHRDGTIDGTVTLVTKEKFSPKPYCSFQAAEAYYMLAAILLVLICSGLLILESLYPLQLAGYPQSDILSFLLMTTWRRTRWMDDLHQNAILVCIAFPPQITSIVFCPTHTTNCTTCME